MKRGAISKDDSRLINVWIPDQLSDQIDVGVRLEDSDRSKFVRNAVREKLSRLGIRVVEKEVA